MSPCLVVVVQRKLLIFVSISSGFSHFFYSLRTFFDERQMSTYNFSSDELVVKRHYKQYSQLVVVGEAQLHSTDNKFL